MCDIALEGAERWTKQDGLMCQIATLATSKLIMITCHQRECDSITTHPGKYFRHLYEANLRKKLRDFHFDRDPASVLN